MSKIYTAQMRYKDPRAIDITVKGQDPVGKILAPTWDMVKGLKDGFFDENTYRAMYVDKLDTQKFGNPYGVFLDPDIVILKCFCKPLTFCHRVLAARWLRDNYGAEYRGEIDPSTY